MVHPVKYVLFVFMTFLMGAVLILVKGPSVIRRITVSPSSYLAMRWVMLVLSGILLIMYLFDISLPWARAALAVLVTYTVPGYALIELTGLPGHRLDPLGKLCFSFCYSLLLSFLLSLVLIPLGPWAMGLTCTTLFFGIAVILNVKAFRDLKHGRWKEAELFSIELGELMALSISVAFFIFIAVSFYPAMVCRPCLDIIRIANYVDVWLRTPNMLSTVYPGFVLSEATAFVISGMIPYVFQSTVEFLNVIMILSFFLTAKAIFRDSNRALPALTTLLFTFFAGLGWLYMLIHGPVYGGTHFELLSLAFEKTYRDIGQAGVMDFLTWYRPRSAALILLLMTVYSILIKGRPWPYRLNLALLSTSLFFMHVSEYMLLVASLLLLVPFKVARILRLGRIIEGLLCSWVFIGLIYGVSWAYGITASMNMVPISLMALLTPLYLGALVLLRSGKLGLTLGEEHNKALSRAVIFIVVFFYLSAIPAWLDQAPDFSIRSIKAVWLLPWFFYPVLLGLAVPMAAIGLHAIAHRHVKFHHDSLALLTSFVISSLLIGRLITFINTTFFYTGYQECRLPRYTLVFLCPLAALSLIKLHPWIKRRRSAILSSGFLVLIVLAGSLSTFYSIEMWTMIVEAKPLDEEEYEALRYLRELVNNMVISRVLTVTSFSSCIVKKASPTFVLKQHSHAIWASSMPELALSILFDGRLRPNDEYIVYMHSRDFREAARSSYEEKFFFSHLLPMADKVFENRKVSIYLIPQFSPPKDEASTVLVVPDEYASALAAYDMLSFNFFDYTTAMEFDPWILDAELLVLPTDRVPEVMRHTDYLKWISEGRTILVMGGREYGPFTELFLSDIIRTWVEECGVYLDVPDIGLLRNYTTHRTYAEIDVLNAANETKPRVICDDKQSSFWTPDAWGSGTIGVPVISDDKSVRVSGQDALRIDVGAGDKAQWALTHYYDPPVNWTGYDFLSFYWYGRGDNVRYIVWVSAPDNENMLWFMFVDNWKGWRKVILPLKGVDGIYYLNGIKIRKITSGEPNLANITYVSIRLGGGNLNVAGTWYLDRVLLDVGRWIDLRAEVRNAPWIDLYIFNGTTYLKLHHIIETMSLEIPPEMIVFSDGSTASALYGPKAKAMILKANITPEGLWELRISIRIPSSGGGPVSRIRLKLETAERIIASRLIIPGDEIELPYPLNCTPLSWKEEVNPIAWYSDGDQRTPLLMERHLGSGSIYYLNAEPLLEAIRLKPEGGLKLFKVLKPVLKLAGLREALWNKEIIEPSSVLFEEAKANGSIELCRRQVSILSSSDHITLKIGSVELKGIKLICLMADENIVLRISNASISGLGFYVVLRTDELTLDIRKGRVSLLLLFQNGTRTSVELEGSIGGVIRGHGFEAFLRTPEIKVNGELFLKNAYVCSYFEMRFEKVITSYLTGEVPGDVLRVLWGDVYINGITEIHFVSGGGISLTFMSYQGEAKIRTPQLTWDEIGSIARAWYWFLIAGIITAAPLLIKVLSRSRGERA